MSRRLWDHGHVRRSHRPQPYIRNSSIHSPGTVPGALPSWDQWSFRKERRLLPCGDFLRGVFLCYEPSDYLIKPPRYDQVLTGLLPYSDNDKDSLVVKQPLNYNRALRKLFSYGDSDKDGLITHIKHGRRPSRPTDPSRNQWLQDPVWDTLTTCWNDKPEKRCELSIVHHVFSTSGLLNTKPDKPGNLNVQSTETSQSLKIPRHRHRITATQRNPSTDRLFFPVFARNREAY